MTQMGIAESIRQANDFFQQKHWLWPWPLIVFLEELQPKLSLRWAISLYVMVLDNRSKRGSKMEQRLWLDELICIMGDPDKAIFCKQRADVIWNNDQEFNFFERAISRLYTATQFFHTASTLDFYRTVTKSVCMLAENDETDAPWDLPVAEQAVSSFEILATSGFIQILKDY